ncbi:MAG: metallophosphoesterase [Hyphomicrobiales bacterium]|nr:metallophosphoesterase [Hyphomicrobiales bacterium]
MMFVLGHLSDPHLSPPQGPRLRELFGKRVLGVANWYGRRRREHRGDVLELLKTDLAAQQCDHVAVTGDLVVVALPGEFAPARGFLQAIGSPAQTTFVPGNHDAYVRAALQAWHPHWGDYMAGDDQPGAPPAEGRFPFVRRRGPVALVGLSTALPTGPFMAWGRLGEPQLQRLRQVLAQLSTESVFRVVLLHHAPDDRPPDPRRGLKDAAAFRAVVREVGCELVLHGHHHTRSLAWIDGPAAPVPVAGVASASATAHNRHPATYNLYRISACGRGWRCEMIVRGLDPAGDRFVELERLEIGAPARQGGPAPQ